MGGNLNGKKGLKEAFNKFSNYHLEMDAHLNIVKYLNIIIYIFENIKLNKRNKGLKRWEKDLR